MTKEFNDINHNERMSFICSKCSVASEKNNRFRIQSEILGMIKND